MLSNMQSAVDEAGKIVKKQKICAQKVDDCLDQLVSLVAASKQQLLADTSCSSQTLPDLHKRIEELSLVKSLSSSTKDFHKSISGLDKALEKAYDNIDICKALRDVQFDRATLNKILAEHFYREGRFEVADQFADECGLEDGETIKRPFAEMHMILGEIRARNLAPALQWAQQHRTQLTQDGSPSDFEFRLHSLAFRNTLTTEGCMSALRYAQTQLSPFQRTHLRDIQRLMGCLVFARRTHTPHAASQPHTATHPYTALMGPQHWDDTAQEFTRLACSVLGQAQESPLLVAVAAGSKALPQLLKMVALDSKVADIRRCEQLPLEVELGGEFVFRSIFACPVSKDQSSESNPPVLLPCNHVLCHQSILKIAKSRTRVFKCPYCPMDARPDNVRELKFPDLQ